MQASALARSNLPVCRYLYCARRVLLARGLVHLNDHNKAYAFPDSLYQALVAQTGAQQQDFAMTGSDSHARNHLLAAMLILVHARYQARGLRYVIDHSV